LSGDEANEGSDSEEGLHLDSWWDEDIVDEVLVDSDWTCRVSEGR
jgi:hypothetical protein